MSVSHFPFSVTWPELSSDERWHTLPLAIKLYRCQAKLLWLETISLPPGCHKGNNNSKSGTTPFLEKRQLFHATKTFTNCSLGIWSHCGVLFPEHKHRIHNHFPVPILGRFLNPLWPDISRTEGAQKNKMAKKMMWKCHLEERPGTEKKL